MLAHLFLRLGRTFTRVKELHTGTQMQTCSHNIRRSCVRGGRRPNVSQRKNWVRLTTCTDTNAPERP